MVSQRSRSRSKVPKSCRTGRTSFGRAVGHPTPESPGTRAPIASTARAPFVEQARQPGTGHVQGLGDAHLMPEADWSEVWRLRRESPPRQAWSVSDPLALVVPVRGDLLRRLHPGWLAGHLRVVGRVVGLTLTRLLVKLDQRLDR